MRTFEFDDGKSQKFWNIDLQGDHFTVTFGKIGSTGRTQTKTFADAARAIREHDKLVAEKLKKGYVETTPSGSNFSSPLRATLEAALAENPDDQAASMAYADHLHELGDPLGDLAQVQIALENEGLGSAARQVLQERETELLNAHLRGWLGPMAPWWVDQTIEDWQQQSGYYNSLTWRRGWIDELRIDNLADDVARAIVEQQNQLRLLRSLIVIRRDYEGPGLQTLLTADIFANLRRFQIGPEGESCHIDGGNTVEFVTRMPRLEELHCYAHRVDSAAIFAMNLPHLRKLTIHHIHSYPLEILAANQSLSNLTDLCFWPHALEPGDEAAYITSEGAQAVFRSPNLKNVRHLQLRLSDTGDEGMRVLVESGMLRRLKTLDLRGGCVTDVGARILAECPDLRNLDRLDLTNNLIGTEGVALLQAVGIPLEIGQQFDPDDVNDDEREYLWYGDCE